MISPPGIGTPGIFKIFTPCRKCQIMYLQNKKATYTSNTAGGIDENVFIFGVIVFPFFIGFSETF